MADPTKISVVIVDDIAETRENIRKLLQFEPNIEVVGVARSGAEAIKVSGETDPDVVLMDINMPDMDGIAVLKFLKEKNMSVPVIILSADIQNTTRTQCFELGAVDFINKPAQNQDLLNALEKALKI